MCIYECPNCEAEDFGQVICPECGMELCDECASDKCPGCGEPLPE